MPDIKLTKKAGDLREQAQTELDELRERVQRQANGELGEDETKMSADEISQATVSIEEKFAEAKAIEKMNSLEGLAERATQEDGGVSPLVKEVLMEAGWAPKQEEDKPVFKSIGEFLRAVRATTGEYEDFDLEPKHIAKLAEQRELASRIDRGDSFNEKILGEQDAMKAFEEKQMLGSNAGQSALVPNVFMSELLRAMAEQQVFAGRARHIPMQRRTVVFPRLTQTDQSNDRMMHSFAAITKIGEGVQKDRREPTFEQFTLTAVKYAAYLEAADELLAESIVNLRPLLVELLTDAISYEYDRDTIRGSGSSEPQGYIGSTSAWVQNREGANGLTIGDIFGMEERFFGTDGIYLHHPTIFPQLAALADSNVIVWNPDLATSAPGTLLGRPLIKTHKVPALGTEGDFSLVDPSFYIAGDLQSVTIQNSIHAAFRNDLTAWRAVFRAAGAPWPEGLFSMEASGGQALHRVSPFVVLGDVASS